MWSFGGGNLLETSQSPYLNKQRAGLQAPAFGGWCACGELLWQLSISQLGNRRARLVARASEHHECITPPPSH